MNGTDNNGNKRSVDEILADVARYCKGCEKLAHWRFEISEQVGMPYPECCPCNACLFGKYGYGGKPEEAA